MWPIPATAQAIVAARIDRLPPDEKAVLQAASVIGPDVPSALLKSIADVPETNLRRALTDLEAAEFLYETSLFPDLEYTFKQTLTHEVAYASLLHDRRRALHARIVEALETLYRDGLTALHPLPETREKIERAIDLRLDLRQSLFPLNELTTVWRYLQEAEGLARTLDDPRRLGWVSVYMSGHLVHTGGHVTEVRTFADRVEAIAGRLGDFPLQIAAQYYLAAASYLSGDYHGTEHVCRKVMQSLRGQPTREGFGLMTSPAVWSHAQLARALAERGILDEELLMGKRPSFVTASCRRKSSLGQSRLAYTLENSFVFLAERRIVRVR